jgi:nucleotide-binding universal stress UspA family protein
MLAADAISKGVRGMIRKILIPSDGSTLSARAVQSGIELAKATGAAVVGLMVIDPYPLKMYGDLMFKGIEPMQHYHDEERQLALRALAPIETAAGAAGVRYSSSSMSSRSPADAIIATADQEGCDLICMATKDHRDLLGVHLGKETVKVLTHARVPVLVCH